MKVPRAAPAPCASAVQHCARVFQVDGGTTVAETPEVLQLLPAHTLPVPFCRESIARGHHGTGWAHQTVC